MSTTIIERFRLAQAKNKEYITTLREHIDNLTTQLDTANGQIAFYMSLPKSNPDEILAITEQNQMQLKTIADMQVKLDENAAKLKEEEAQLEAMAQEEESMSLELAVEPTPDVPVEVAVETPVEVIPVVETPVEVVPVVETPVVEVAPEVLVEATPVAEVPVEVPAAVEAPIEVPVEVAPVEVVAEVETPVVEAAPAVEGVKVDEVTPSASSTESTTVIDSVPSLDTDSSVKNIQVNTSDNILAAPIEVHQVETPAVDSSATVNVDTED